MLCAGIRPFKRCLRRPQERASSITPSALSRYKRAKARISAMSPLGSTPANKYAALPVARNDSAVGSVQIFMHSTVAISNARISASPEAENNSRNAVACATPCGATPALQQVAQTVKQWRITRVRSLKTLTLSWAISKHRNKYHAC